MLHDLHVTMGHVFELPNGRLRVMDPKTRLVTTGRSNSAELRFRYHGSTAETTALASGEVRRQLGLKLRALDGCNVVYAMWRIAPPQTKLAVSVKRNEGQSRHIECGVRGYADVAAMRSAPIPTPVPGQSYVFAARIEGERMVVSVDTKDVWEGTLPKEAFAFDGPAGVRTDNVDIEFEFLAGK